MQKFIVGVQPFHLKQSSMVTYISKNRCGITQGMCGLCKPTAMKNGFAAVPFAFVSVARRAIRSNAIAVIIPSSNVLSGAFEIAFV